MKFINDVNMTRPMSRDPQQKKGYGSPKVKGLKLLRFLCFSFVLAASVTSCRTDAQQNGIHLLMTKREEVKIDGSKCFFFFFLTCRNLVSPSSPFLPPLPPTPHHHPKKPVITKALHSQSRPVTQLNVRLINNSAMEYNHFLH